MMRWISYIPISLMLILVAASASAASSLRAYAGTDGTIHFTDRHASGGESLSLFDESVLDAAPLVDYAQEQALAQEEAQKPESASLARSAAYNHPVKTVLIETTEPAILFGEGKELYRGQIIEKPTAVRQQKARRVDRPSTMNQLFHHYSRMMGLDPRLAKAVAKVESNFNPRAVSHKGAKGLMQLMPATAKELGVNDPFDLEQAIYGGCLYLKRQLDRFDGNIDLALAAYNAGPGAVKRYNGIPPYRETRNYVKKVKRAMTQLSNS